MGNCVRTGSVGHWTDEDWDHSTHETSGNNPSELLLKLQIERKMLVDNKKEVFCVSGCKKAARQVKIKITRRELEELLGGKTNYNEHGLWNELNVALLLRKQKSELDVEEHGHRSSYDAWRPSLESIEELD